MVEVFFNIMIVLNIMVILKMAFEMVMVFILMLMEMFIKECGDKILLMDKVHIIIKAEMNIKVIGSKEDRQDMAYINLLMV